jgi:hypothetical protein
MIRFNIHKSNFRKLELDINIKVIIKRINFKQLFLFCV